MESSLYGVFALVGFVSEISLVRCAHSFNFRYVTNARAFHEVISISLMLLLCKQGLRRKLASCNLVINNQNVMGDSCFLSARCPVVWVQSAAKSSARDLVAKPLYQPKAATLI